MVEVIKFAAALLGNLQEDLNPMTMTNVAVGTIVSRVELLYYTTSNRP